MYYVLDSNFQGVKTLINRSAADGCGVNCRITAVASRVQKTNLLLLVYTTGTVPCPESCQEKLKVAVEHGAKPVYNATDKVHEDGSAVIRPRYRRSLGICYTMETVDEFDPPPCSHSPAGFRSSLGLNHVLRRFLLPVVWLAVSRFLLTYR